MIGDGRATVSDPGKALSDGISAKITIRRPWKLRTRGMPIPCCSFLPSFLKKPGQRGTYAAADFNPPPTLLTVLLRSKQFFHFGKDNEHDYATVTEVRVAVLFKKKNLEGIGFPSRLRCCILLMSSCISLIIYRISISIDVL
jgi:hypothetical protein